MNEKEAVMYFKLARARAFTLVGLIASLLCGSFAYRVWNPVWVIFALILIATLVEFFVAVRWDWRVRRFQTHFTKVLWLPAMAEDNVYWLVQTKPLVRDEVEKYARLVRQGAGKHRVYKKKITAALVMGIWIDPDPQCLPQDIQKRAVHM
jgi:hypothetical protein